MNNALLEQMAREADEREAALFAHSDRVWAAVANMKPDADGLVHFTMKDNEPGDG